MAGGDEAVDLASWYSSLAYDQWVTLPVAGRRPPGRYKHAAAVVDQKLYISGGSRNGRHLSDVQVFDFTNSTWSSLKLSPEPNAAKSEEDSLLETFPATSGHHMVVWGEKVLIFDGQPKRSSYVTVRYLDLETQQFGVVETIGELPAARAGHSTTLFGSKLIMFGGEDIHRKLLNDIHILNLETMTWNKVQATQPPPSPRYDHAASIHAQRYLLVFGGCSHSTCFNDLHVLDLHTMEWSQTEIRGDYVTPRAGHCGATINGNWFIVGGGDNKGGATETLVLDMTKLVWSVVTKVNGRDPIASEGISVCSASIQGERYLFAFGGYNGTYNNEVFVMRPKIKESVKRKIYQSPAAAAAAASVSAAYSIGSGKTEYPKQEVSSDTDETKEAKGLLESSLAEVRGENSMLQGKIDDLNSTHKELSKELASVQGQLVAERSRCFKLEAQIAELQSMLASLPSIEAEVQSLRKEKSALEQDMEHAKTEQREGSRGVWGWLSGAP